LRLSQIETELQNGSFKHLKQYFCGMSKWSLWLSLVVLLLSQTAKSQDTVMVSGNYLTIGSPTAGICLGNAYNYSGLRLNLNDRNVRKINGVNVHFLARRHHFYFDPDSTQWETAVTNGFNFGIFTSAAVQTNGLGIGLLANADVFSNGISLSAGFNTAGQTRNGLSFGLLTLRSTSINGIGASAFWVTGERLNGFFVSAWAVSGGAKTTIYSIKGMAIAPIAIEARRIHGVAIGGVGVGAIDFRGLAIGLITNTKYTQGVQIGVYNASHNLRGVQIGLLNRARNNPPWARWLPIVNFHFGKFEMPQESEAVGWGK